MGRKILLLLLMCMLVLVLTGCDGTTTGNVIKNPKIEVELVQPLPTGGYVKVKGISDLDLNALNQTVRTDKRGNNPITQNQEFMIRISINYPNGNPARENVVLKAGVPSSRIPILQMVTRGYEYTGETVGKYNGDEITLYNFNYGSLKEGTTHEIIFLAKAGSLKSDMSVTTPLFIELHDASGSFLNNKMPITIKE